MLAICAENNASKVSRERSWSLVMTRRPFCDTAMQHRLMTSCNLSSNFCVGDKLSNMIRR